MQTVTPNLIESRLVELIASFGADRSLIDRDATFEMLNVDSLDLVELGQVAEEEFNVEMDAEDLKRIVTVGDAIDLVAERAA